MEQLLKIFVTLQTVFHNPTLNATVAGGISMGQAHELPQVLCRAGN
ncbi:hypothetical protein ACX0G7_17785 [Flavitalea antarctica]